MLFIALTPLASLPIKRTLQSRAHTGATGMATTTPLPLFLIVLALLLTFLSSSSAQQQPSPAVQLTSSESRALFRLRRQLEYPSALSVLTELSASICSIPPTPSLNLSCSSSGHLTTLYITGDKPRLLNSQHRDTLSSNFSTTSVFATLSRFTSLTDLSLVSLGMWGTLPPDIHRRLPASSLLTLNLSSNYLYGPIPPRMPNMAALQQLDLSGNILAGNVPDLSNMAKLQLLDISKNKLGPEWPLLPAGGTSASLLVSLSLGNNSFKCPLPTGPDQVNTRLARLENLDAPYNRFYGQVPAEILALPALKRLVLAGNALSGTSTTVTCGKALETVDLSGNRLVGSLPKCLVDRVAIQVLDVGNCLAPPAADQHPTTYCNQLPLAVLPKPDQAKGGEPHHKEGNLGKVLGAVFGVIGGVTIVAFVVMAVFVIKKNKLHGTETDDSESKGWVLQMKNVKNKGISTAKGLPIGGKIAPEVRLGVHGFLPYQSFSMEEMKEMTNHFDPMNVVTESSDNDEFPKLYKGWLQDGSAVMVRCLRLKPKLSLQALRHFTSLTFKLQHAHLVSVLGHCVDDTQQDNTPIYLVFEHVSNGTLRSHLDEWRKRELLKWPQRVAAVIGIARGVQFLHNVGVYGNDIRVDNMLVSETLSVKISNYGLPISPVVAKNDKVSSPKAGNHGGVHEDIYNLGLLMLELVTGRHATTPTELEVLKQQVQKILTEGPVELRELIDPAIIGTFTYESLKTVAEVALSCLSQQPDHRPSIDDVLWNLQYSAQAQYACASSENLSVVSCTNSSA